VNILRVLSMWFLWWIFAIWQYYFSKTKPSFWFWYFQPSHLSLLLTQKIYCDTLDPWQNKYDDHNVRCNEICHSFPLHSIFLKLQLEFQTSYMNLISIHISFLKFFILKWKIYTLILNIFIWIWKFISQLWNYYFNLKQWFSIM
jgi:hypothetical protein